MSARRSKLRSILDIHQDDEYTESLHIAGRGVINRGDRLKVRSHPGKRDGFHARFGYAYCDRGGLVLAVQELQGKAGKPERWRFVTPDRIVRRRVKV